MMYTKIHITDLSELYLIYKEMNYILDNLQLIDYKKCLKLYNKRQQIINNNYGYKKEITELYQFMKYINLKSKSKIEIWRLRNKLSIIVNANLEHNLQNILIKWTISI